MLDLDTINTTVQALDPSRAVEWAAREFGGERLVMSSSFGADSAVLIHVATRVLPRIPIVFVDTGFLFRETHQFLEQLRQRFDLNVLTYRPLHDPVQWLRQRSATEVDPTRRVDVESCCAVNKNEPFDRAMRELAPAAWLRGIRRDQADTRRERQVVEWSARFGCYAVSPLLNWSRKDMHEYMKRHDLPYHPLYEKGYASIGCSPLSCTRPIMPGEDPRAGRWSGSAKVECGLHVEQK
jgi:phosphoadenosine phosphosulfate reductase